MGTFIGVDVGGTLLRAARFDHDFTILERVQTESLANEGSDAVVDRLIEVIEQVLPENPDDLTGIGLGVPGPVDVTQGVIVAPPNLPWENLPVARIVKEAIRKPVHLGNDADVAALAEQWLGAGKGTQHMIYMTISTGIGGGIIDSGRLISGGGMGGEVGHMTIVADGPQCGCGRYGHLEALASGTAIGRIARERLAAGEQSAILELAGGEVDNVTASLVGQAALASDELAMQLIKTAGRYIGIGIASLMHIFNPEMFVLGGGVTRTGDLLFDAIRAAARENAMHPRFFDNTPIVSAQLGGDVGLMGAALLVQLHGHD